jgi:hypothetical protein
MTIGGSINKGLPDEASRKWEKERRRPGVKTTGRAERCNRATSAVRAIRIGMDPRFEITLREAIPTDGKYHSTLHAGSGIPGSACLYDVGAVPGNSEVPNENNSRARTTRWEIDEDHGGL